MLRLRGTRAVSAFRTDKLLAEARRVAPVESLFAEFWHFAHLDGELGPAEQQILERLLRYGPRDDAGALPGLSRLVVPRPGTISPWSSKATDIAWRCGLETVRRLERGVLWTLGGALDDSQCDSLSALLHDRMTEAVLAGLDEVGVLFSEPRAAPLDCVDLATGESALQRANSELGLALSAEEIAYLYNHYARLDRRPTDVELMMFAQVNSEHCRHKIFNAAWEIDGMQQNASLFDMIRNTHRCHPQGTLSAYSDNSAVIAGPVAERFFASPQAQVYDFCSEPVHIMMKVETHNHPTAISPHPGAATGSGGEIRDEGATGRGARPKAGVTGFCVSNLRFPDATLPWETEYGRPGRIVSALDIMLEGPIGAASFNNEFGRPAIGGYFRSFELEVPGEHGTEVRGYHKPIMLAGGLGNIRQEHVKKAGFPAGTPIVLLGGPAMLIGLGGGAASSMATGSSDAELDFASVQRSNPELQRRCQEVIDRCWALGEDNPILSIHDVGAGGLSNALPELVADAGRGGHFELAEVPNEDRGMSPMQIWCNEAQERYVLAIRADRLDHFRALCARERCPMAVAGTASDDYRLLLEDNRSPHPGRGNCQEGARPIDLDLDFLLGKTPRMQRRARRLRRTAPALPLAQWDLKESAYRVLRLPTVADKSFLITIGDRSVGGLVARDPMVGPWQVPVADVAVTLAGFRGHAGEAMSIGERTPLALLDSAASARMAVAESLTNLLAADIADLGTVKLSANWMVAAGHPGEDAALFDAVRAVGEELCPVLGLSIPVGKDSMSMKTVWKQDGEQRSVTAPMSLVVTAFTPLADARRVLTPVLEDIPGTRLLLVDLAAGERRLGGSALAQVYSLLGDRAPDVADPKRLLALVAWLRESREHLLAYHDRSDGGLFACLAEMQFASHCGLEISLDAAGVDAHELLFNEELGVVVQVRGEHAAALISRGLAAGLAIQDIGAPSAGERLRISVHGEKVFDELRTDLQLAWNETSFRIQQLRDNPQCAREARAAIAEGREAGLRAQLGFDADEDLAAPFIGTGARPAVAILREQGVNGHTEMAAAFHAAGFECHDLTMTDLLSGDRQLASYRGAVACGGFSFGDVLGAGEGWAKSILFNSRLRDAFAEFFGRSDSFALGVCNGCQMLSNLRELIPGAEDWPHFVRNRSEQFEARLSQVSIPVSPSLFFSGMHGSSLPLVIAHGEGRAEFSDDALRRVQQSGLVALRFVDDQGQPAERYPSNPNGSPDGITGLTTPDGRYTILMPHPERILRSVNFSWHPRGWGDVGPWMRMFRNARAWLG
ncbi:MAG: phosphoribosylformylglycinamidine synthase [Gammaproteobacteria bacterium]|nr:phosphoribosylformylglycinamidine synthase [Gammaproteobacteria bacterium]